MNDYLPLLVVVGLGGFVIWYITKQQQPPPAAIAPPAQCGASYVGVGINVPCQLVAAGIKQLTTAAQKTLKPVTQELGVAASGIKTWEYVVTPVAISHATYNEAKHVLSSIF